MKKKIAILGSTGSIGKATLNIIKQDKKKYDVILLSANKNYAKISSQIKSFKPRYYIINDFNVYMKIKKKYLKSKTKIIYKFENLKINKFKFDISICAIVGIVGLEPTIKFSKISKKVLLANKESIICGWHILKKICLQKKTEIIPIDSEHFSIKELTKDYMNHDIEKIFITGSGGPFLRKPIKKFKNIKIKDAINHPNWSMGKKISVDSSTMMNKVLEVIEAYHLFPFDKKKYQIIIHPQSLIHAIVFLKNGQSKLLFHEPDMRIPIANALYDNKINIRRFIKFKNKTNYKNFGDLKFENVDKKRFPIVTLLSEKIYKNSGAIILNASNEVLVNEFLKKRLTFNSIYPSLKRVFKHKDFKKYAIKRSPNINEIYKIDAWARHTTLKIVQNSNEKKNY